MPLEVVTKGQEWKMGEYRIKFGKMTVNRPDVYHIYYGNQYVAQRSSLDGAEGWIKDDIERNKGK